MMVGSKVRSGAASAITCGEMPCASASFLKSASHFSKLAVFWQRGAARAGPANAVTSNAAAHFNTVLRIEKVRLALGVVARQSARRAACVKRDQAQALTGLGRKMAQRGALLSMDESWLRYSLEKCG